MSLDGDKIAPDALAPNAADPSQTAEPVDGIYIGKRPRAEETDNVLFSQAQEAEDTSSPDTKRTKTDNNVPTTTPRSLPEEARREEEMPSTKTKEENDDMETSNSQNHEKLNTTEEEATGNYPKPAHSGWLTSPAVTRRRASEKLIDKGAGGETSEDGMGNETKPLEGPYRSRTGGDRWIVHQMTEDYIGFVGEMMHPGRQFRPYGFERQNTEYPLDGVSPLGYLKSPLRRPTVIERWSPYEIAVFEAALVHHGKEFHKVQKEIGTKSTREVIDFYYTWKKTAHYKKWKEIYVSDDMLDYEPIIKTRKS